ncbi:MAG: class II fumarate hydratase, partial [Deltaproteobacteria bacterium]|nr:class II fumarate hydratase [Deltaproteobacteria bacterium]
NLLHSKTLLADSCKLFAKYMVEGMEANEKRIKELLNQSLMLVTALNPKIGYDKSAKIAYKAHKEDKTLKEACLELGYLSEAEFDEVVRPEKMIRP